MNIALIGATGFIGSALLQEALQRGHQVTALVRDASKLSAHPQLRAVSVDVQNQDALAAQLKGQAAVISAFSGHSQTDVHQAYLKGLQAIVAATKQAGVKRFLIVGGAGSLEVAPGKQLVDTPEFPNQWKASALGARDALNLMRNETQLDWTMLSPSAYIFPGERTGQFRLGGDQLLTDAQGKSQVSVQDYAVAMLDELEKGAHVKQRFTVGY